MHHILINPKEFLRIATAVDCRIESDMSYANDHYEWSAAARQNLYSSVDDCAVLLTIYMGITNKPRYTFTKESFKNAHYNHALHIEDTEHNQHFIELYRMTPVSLMETLEDQYEE